MYKDKIAEYAKMQRMNSSPREIEAEALTLAANKLIYCRDNWEAEERNTLLDEALKFNQRLWSIFQANLVSKDNLLPKSVKLNILKLSAVVDKKIFQIKAYPSPERLTSIIDINLSLAEGLRKKPDPAGTKR
ncbi:MAG: flagellar biosynthesis regulator FlaF [Smithellaceae bacterium]